MRLISSDGCLDIPYEQVTLEIMLTSDEFLLTAEQACGNENVLGRYEELKHAKYELRELTDDFVNGCNCHFIASKTQMREKYPINKIEGTIEDEHLLLAILRKDFYTRSDFKNIDYYISDEDFSDDDSRIVFSGMHIFDPCRIADVIAFKKRWNSKKGKDDFLNMNLSTYNRIEREDIIKKVIAKMIERRIEELNRRID